jgi:inner membrane protein
VDNLTHTLTALALSQAGLNRKTRFATLALVVGANLPDVDLVWAYGGAASYLKYHRGITHSFLGVTVLAALLATTIYLAGRRAAPKKKNAPPLDARWLFVLCWIGTASHLLLDFTNQYGVRPFLPFSGRWYAWDIMFIFDPLLLALLALGLGVPAILRLASQEVGAVGAQRPTYRWGAMFSLVCLVLLWGVRDLAHRRVLGFLDSHTYGEENPVRLGAFPSPANPFSWSGVVETESAYHVLPANALASDVDASNTEVFHRPQRSQVLDAALKSRTGAIFASFARFLWAEVYETDDGSEVFLRDLRFFSPSSPNRGFVARIELDKDLRARSESFSFAGNSSK